MGELNTEAFAEDKASAYAPSQATETNDDCCTPGGSNGAGNTVRNRQRPATAVQLLIAKHDEEAQHSRRTDKKRLKITKQFVHLQT